MNRKGFAFLETIVAVIILTTSLILLYTSFSRLLQTEKSRVYYDDISFTYRSMFIKRSFDQVNFLAVIKDLLGQKSDDFVLFGIDYQDLFIGEEETESGVIHKAVQDRDYLSKMLDDYEVKNMLVIKTDRLEALKKCDPDSAKKNDDPQCNKLYTSVSSSMIDYISSINVEISCFYILVIEYNVCNKCDTGNCYCKPYYSWVSV